MSEKKFTDVYYAQIPAELEIGTVHPRLREEEIRSCKSEKTKAEKYFVWRLLEYAVEKSLGLDFKALNFTKTEQGKWTTDGFYFSLSHSEGLSAVAISAAPVGIDVEEVRKRDYERLSKRALTPEEKLGFDELPEEERAEAFTLLWTKKESIFKMQNDPDFLPNKTNITSADVHVLTLKDGGHCIAVAHKNEKVRILEKCHPV